MTSVPATETLSELASSAALPPSPLPSPPPTSPAPPHKWDASRTTNHYQEPSPNPSRWDAWSREAPWLLAKPEASGAGAEQDQCAVDGGILRTGWGCCRGGLHCLPPRGPHSLSAQRAEDRRVHCALLPHRGTRGRGRSARDRGLSRITARVL